MLAGLLIPAAIVAALFFGSPEGLGVGAIKAYAEAEAVEGEDEEEEDGDSADSEEGEAEEGDEEEEEEYVYDPEAGFGLEGLALESGEEYYRRFADDNVSINVFNWGEYISDGSDDSLNVNRAFTEATGIRVNYTTFSTNEELHSKLLSGYVSYDVVIPSDYMIGRMASEGLLLPLDFDNIPNIEYIDPQYRGLDFDPEAKYCAPYTWGYVGIIYNKTLIAEGEDVETWDVLWDEKYLGDILMFANSRDAFAIAQKRAGYSLNTTNPDELAACLEALKEQKPLVQAYVMDEIFDKMLGGEAAFAPYYAGDALTMMGENEDLGFAIPREGTNIFVDAMCIPTVSRNKEAAEMYINFLLEPEVGLANSEYIGYGSPNNAVLEIMDEEMRDDPITYPPDEALANTEAFSPLPAETNALMDQMWTELLSNDENYNRMVVPVFLLAALLLSIGLNAWRAYKKHRIAAVAGVAEYR